MLTSQEAEISILEEELEKMAVVAGECSGRACLAEEKLSLKEVECGDVSSKLPWQRYHSYHNYHSYHSLMFLGSSILLPWRHGNAAFMSNFNLKKF